MSVSIDIMISSFPELKHLLQPIFFMRPDASKLPEIYRKLGLDFDEKVLPSIINEVSGGNAPYFFFWIRFQQVTKINHLQEPSWNHLQNQVETIYNNQENTTTKRTFPGRSTCMVGVEERCGSIQCLTAHHPAPWIQVKPPWHRSFS